MEESGILVLETEDGGYQIIGAVSSQAEAMRKAGEYLPKVYPEAGLVPPSVHDQSARAGRVVHHL